MIAKKEGRRPPLIKTEFGYFLIRTDLIDPLEGQPRHYFDPTEMGELKGSIRAVGQQKPVTVTPKKGRFVLTDGERRWRACTELEVKYMKAGFDDNKDGKSVYFRSLILNLNGAEHTHKDMFEALMALIVDGNKPKDICVALGKSDGWIYMYTSLARLHPDLLEFIDSKNPEDKLPVQVAAKLAQLPADDQLEVYCRTKKETLTRRRMMIHQAVDTHPERRSSAKKNRYSDRVKAFGKGAITRLEVEKQRLELLISQNVPKGFYDRFGDGDTRNAVRSLKDLSDTLLKFAGLLETVMKQARPFA